MRADLDGSRIGRAAGNKRRLLALTLASALAGAAHAAEPDFSTSTASHEPAQVIAGDVIRYTVVVRNSGGDGAYARIATTLPQGYFIRADGDCDAAQINDDRKLVWHEGSFAAGSAKRCRIDFLTRKVAAGTFAPLATEITTVPGGYLRIETSPELASPADPSAIRVGPVNVTQAGLAVLAFLALVLAGAAIVMRIGKQRSGSLVTPLRAWFAVATAVGFLIYFLTLARDDLRSYTDYQKTSCFIFGSTIHAFPGTGKSAGSSTYKPDFAVRYDAFGAEIYSTASPPPTAVSSGRIGFSQRRIERFAVGSVQPCWFDPKIVKTVLLERGPGGAYFFAIIPLVVLICGWWMMVAMLRPRRKGP